MSLVYVLSFICLFLTIFLFKKSDKKLNGLISIVYIFGILFFYDSLCAFAFSSLNIKNSLLIFSLINLIVSGVIYYISYKKNGKFKKQKYSFNKKEIVCFSILLLVCFGISFFRYSGFTSIKYRINDAAVHYKHSVDYSNYQKLFDSGFKDEVYDFNHGMFGFYVPCGIFMKIMPFHEYISYNLFNMFMLMLMGSTFYVTALFVKKGDKQNFLTLLLSLLYTLAYPLNYMFTGFGYLGAGILAANLILLTWKFILKDEKKLYYFLLSLFNLGLFYSYYLFALAIYIAEGLFLIFRYMRCEYSFKKLFKVGILTILIPGLIGAYYFVYGIPSSGSNNSILSVYSIDGYIYKNLIGNFILLIPLVIYSFIVKIKSKESGFDIFCLVLEVLYIIATLIFGILGKVSAYYFYKSYYLLWLIVYVFILDLMNYKKFKTILIVSYVYIICVIFFSIFDVEKMVYDRNNNFMYSGLAKEMANIYSYNVDLYSESYEYSKSDLKFLMSVSKYKKECGIDKKHQEIPFVGNYMSIVWYYSLNKTVPSMDHEGLSVFDTFTPIFKFSDFEKDKDVKCLLISYGYTKAVKMKLNIDYDRYEVLYKDKNGELIKKDF